MRDKFNSLAEALSAITTIAGAVALMASGWAIVWTWVRDWDWMQISMAIIVAVCIIFVAVIAIYAWWRKNQIYKIPNLLYTIDGILRDYVNSYDINKLKVSAQEKSELAIELTELIHVNPYSMANAYSKKNKKRIATETERYAKRYESLINPENRTNDNLKIIMQICGLMNQHGVGLKTVQDTPNYADKRKLIISLQRVVPNPEVNIKISSYFNWADGYYSLLICQKWVTSDQDLFSLSPAEYKAISSYAQPLMESTLDTLIADVSQSMHKGMKREGDK